VQQHSGPLVAFKVSYFNLVRFRDGAVCGPVVVHTALKVALVRFARAVMTFVIAEATGVFSVVVPIIVTPPTTLGRVCGFATVLTIKVACFSSALICRALPTSFVVVKTPCVFTVSSSLLV
jgi:hypothetical protein